MDVVVDVVVGCRRMTAGRWMVGAVVCLNEVMQTTVPDGASFSMHNRVPFGAQKTTTNRPPGNTPINVDSTYHLG